MLFTLLINVPARPLFHIDLSQYLQLKATLYTRAVLLPQLHQIDAYISKFNQCPICLKTFKNKTYLRLHQSRFHSLKLAPRSFSSFMHGLDPLDLDQRRLQLKLRSCLLFTKEFKIKEENQFCQREILKPRQRSVWSLLIPAVVGITMNLARMREYLQKLQKVKRQ